MRSFIRKTRRDRRPALEFLEDRCVPATFGVPWQDAAHLTLSFAPDGTAIASHQSSLFSTLNAQEPANVWQRQIAAAFQTWASYANINFGIVSDGGQPFGAPGQAQADPRFGDIRIGAQKMDPSALSISIPHDPFFSGTWSGDVLVNTNDAFGSNLNLFSVMLHEAGHVLGLPDSTDSQSPMNSNYNNCQTLTSADIAALQALYGVRAPDLNEGSNGNGTFQTATQINPPGGFTGSTPLIAYGDITTNSDVDMFQFKPASNYSGPATIRLQSAGISLLEPKLTVYDQAGNVLGQVQSTNVAGDTLLVHLASVVPGATYFVKAEGATKDVLGIGSYGVAISFDATNQVSSRTIDQVLRAGLQTVSSQDLSTLLSNPTTALLGSGTSGGPGSSTSTTLQPMPGYAKNSHYEIIASLANTQETDAYRITAADPVSGEPTAMTVNVQALAINGAPAQVTVLDNNLNPIPAQVLVHGRGAYTIEVPNVQGGQHYLLQVSADPTSGVTSGNYHMTVDFGHVAVQPTSFASGTLGSSGAQSTYNFYVAENQLFQFLLAAQAPSAPAGTVLEMTITDANGNVVFSQSTPVGQATSGDVTLLTPGAYQIHFSALAPGGMPVPNVAYQLTGSSLSDPIGPTIDDPTLNPMYLDPSNPLVFLYPDGTISVEPYVIVLVPY